MAFDLWDIRVACPFHSGRESSTTTSSQARCLDLIDNLCTLSIAVLRLISMPPRTQSCPLRTISLVLCQSPYFLALARSAPWCPYRFWNILSWSFNPPKCVRFGGWGASCTVANPRVCCAEPAELGNRDAAPADDGRTRLVRAETALVDGACRDSIVGDGCARLSRRWSMS
jgi:hypothetical protein